MKPDKLDMPADVARCNGRIYVGDAQVLCEQRDQCRRWLASRINHPRIVMLMVAGKANVMDCEYFMPQGGISDDVQRTVKDA